MKKLFNPLLFSALVVLNMIGGGCSSGDGKEQNPPTSTTLALSTSKLSILSDGEDKTVLTVLYNNTEDVTAKAELFANDQPLATSEFTTTTPGSYTLKAVYDGVTSNTITITAVSGESAKGITLQASKTAIYSDGGDFAVLTLKTGEGYDVTALGEFYVDGEKLEGNRFSTTKGSLVPVTVSAKFNGFDVENRVQISASSSYTFTYRVLLEDITKTGCQYCPTVIRLIEELRKDAQQLVVPYSIHNSGCPIYWNYYSQATRKFADSFCDFVGVDYSSAPKLYLNHSKNEENEDLLKVDGLRSQAINGPKEVAIALESSLEGTNIPVKVTIGSKKDFSGKIVVVLVENGIEADQTNMGTIEMYRILRAYAPNVTGEAKTFTKGTPTTYSTTFDLNTTKVKNVNNCEVIAFVTDDVDGLSENVQFAKVGEIKGY